jgi:hypothetical protein
MPRHHYLPASYLGNFSEDKKINLRESLLFVKDLENGHVFKRTANDVGCMQNYYPEQVDKILGA